MNDRNCGKDKLRQALAEFAKEYYTEQPSELCIHVPALRPKKKRWELSDRAHSGLRLMGRQILTFALSFLMIVTLKFPVEAMGIGLMPEFMWREDKDAFVVFYNEYDKTRIDVPEIGWVESPGYIPDGYVFIHHHVQERQHVRSYRNASGTVLQIMQSTFREELLFPKGELEPTVFYRNGQQILLCREEDRTVCVWSGRDSVFMLTVYGEICEDEVLQIVNEYEHTSTLIELLLRGLRHEK